MSSMSCSLEARVSADHIHRLFRAHGVNSPLCSICTHPRIAFRGVRSSCDRVARKSSFRRLASSAAASLAISASLRRVTIMQTPLIRAGRPSCCTRRGLSLRTSESCRPEPPGGIRRRAARPPSAPVESTLDSRAIVRMNFPFVARERAVEAALGQAVDTGEVVGPLNDVGREVPVPGAHRCGVQRETQTFFASPRLLSVRVRSTAKATWAATTPASCRTSVLGGVGAPKYSMNLPITRPRLISGMNAIAAISSASKVAAIRARWIVSNVGDPDRLGVGLSGRHGVWPSTARR